MIPELQYYLARNQRARVDMRVSERFWGIDFLEGGKGREGNRSLHGGWLKLYYTRLTSDSTTSGPSIP